MWRFNIWHQGKYSTKLFNTRPLANLLNLIRFESDDANGAARRCNELYFIRCTARVHSDNGSNAPSGNARFSEGVNKSDKVQFANHPFLN